MECQQVGERLPWLLNGTLAGEEAEAVRAHLATCGACREDLAEARRAADVFAAHLPAAALVDVAWGGAAAGLDPGLVQRHLETCPTCAEEVELVRESRRLEEQPAPVVRTAASPRRYDRYLALAASVAVAFATGFWSGRSPGPGTDRIAELEAEAGRLRDQEAAYADHADRMRSQVAALQQQVTRMGELTGLKDPAPQLNLPVFELLQAGITRRSAGPAANEVMVPRDASLVAFLLNAERLPEGPAAMEIKDARGKVLWSGQGLRPNPLGGYTLAVPAALLPPGDYVFSVRAGRGAPATYPVRVRQSD